MSEKATKQLISEMPTATLGIIFSACKMQRHKKTMYHLLSLSYPTLGLSFFRKIKDRRRARVCVESYEILE